MQVTGRPWARLRSPCPLAAALDVLGDRWSLLLVRDLLFFGKRRYAEFSRSPEGIPSNILAERLRRLVAIDLVERRVYREKPRRHEYLLTGRGRELEPALRALVAWAQRHVPGVLPGALPRPVRRPRRPARG